jgi:hypothetical protein
MMDAMNVGRSVRVLKSSSQNAGFPLPWYENGNFFEVPNIVSAPGCSKTIFLLQGISYGDQICDEIWWDPDFLDIFYTIYGYYVIFFLEIIYHILIIDSFIVSILSCQ